MIIAQIIAILTKKNYLNSHCCLSPAENNHLNRLNSI